MKFKSIFNCCPVAHCSHTNQKLPARGRKGGEGGLPHPGGAGQESAVFVLPYMVPYTKYLLKIWFTWVERCAPNEEGFHL